MRTFDYDVIIAGGGVTGCAIARELSRYALDICLLEREEDVCSGTSKANSAIVHAGFDAAPGSMKAQMNVAGSRLMPDLARELDVPFRQNGSMVLCLSPDDRPALEALYRRGLTNGVEGLSLLTGEEGWYARFTVANGRVETFALNLRLYTPGESYTLLPSERLASAAMNAQSLRGSGRRLTLCYSDVGAGTLSAGWIAQE